MFVSSSVRFHFFLFFLFFFYLFSLFLLFFKFPLLLIFFIASSHFLLISFSLYSSSSYFFTHISLLLFSLFSFFFFFCFPTFSYSLVLSFLPLHSCSFYYRFSAGILHPLHYLNISLFISSSCSTSSNELSSHLPPFISYFVLFHIHQPFLSPHFLSSSSVNANQPTLLSHCCVIYLFPCSSVPNLMLSFTYYP